jgi:DNA-binding transcriptional regulator GbsR (MarR family)
MGIPDAPDNRRRNPQSTEKKTPVLHLQADATYNIQRSEFSERMAASTLASNKGPTKDAASPWPRELQRFIEAGGNTTHAFGLGRMIGRMFVVLYLSPRPLSLDEISEQLIISKASASTVVRQLASWRAVRQIWIPGDRRDFYEAETGFGVILREGLLPGIRKKFHSAETQIDRTLQAMPADMDTEGQESTNSTSPPFSKAEQQEIRLRLRAAQAFHKRLNRILSSRIIDHFL